MTVFIIRWTRPPFEVMPNSSPNLNRFCLPTGILHSSFFDVTLPHAINFGSVGSALGHEFEHNFDEEGLNYDQKGNEREWLSNKNAKHFEKRSECFSKQYSNYVVNKHTIDGKATLSKSSLLSRGFNGIVANIYFFNC